MSLATRPARSNHSKRNRLVALLTTLALLVVAVIVPAAARAAKPTPPRTYSAAIETLAPYQPQHRCAQYRRTGTTALGNLLKTTYPRTTWYSLRPCTGGTSEHYDGRAIDWMVSTDVWWQKYNADQFLSWLLATDQHGNQFAMARRLGIMYVIYNNRMWGAWSGRWEEYNGCQAASMQADVYDNSCHRTHAHMSLAWKGAYGETSFWDGTVAQYPTS